MKNTLPKILVAFVLIASASLVFAHYYPQFVTKPCANPIPFSISEVDPQFGLSKQDYLQAVDEAKAIWEKPAGKTLFDFSDKGMLQMNLIYDYRQQAMDKLKTLGIKIESTQGSYNQLDAKYKSMLASYNLQKTEIDDLISQYDALKAKYDADLAAYNSRRGNNTQFQQLQSEYNELNNLGNQINAKKSAVNGEVDTINALVNELNQLAGELNLNVKNYNQVGQSTGSEFEEGVYISDSSGTKINIYEFGDHAELVRVLAHELGHALGLEHVDDPNAIMYKLNQSKNEIPTAADIAELDQVCHLK